MNLTQLTTLMDDLASQPVAVGLFLAWAGIVFLILGHRIFRTLVAVSFGAIGYLFASGLVHDPVAHFAIGALGGFALAMLALFFPRGGVGVLTGCWCAAILWQAGSHFLVNNIVLATVAAVAFIAAISLTFVIYDETIAFVTSLEGSLLTIAAIVVLCSQSPILWSHIRHLVLTTPLFAAFAVLTGTVTGFYFQLADIRHKHTGAGL